MEKKLASIVIMVERFVPLAELSSEDLSSPGIMQHTAVLGRVIVRSRLRQEKIANSVVINSAWHVE